MSRPSVSPRRPALKLPPVPAIVSRATGRLPLGRLDARMTQSNNRFLDELAKLMTDAAGAAQGMRREVETLMRAQGERLLRDLDVVQREEFEAVKEMAVRAREENERLAVRVAALEAEVAVLKARA
jgi:BMFP domain-containing protein YqiC